MGAFDWKLELADGTVADPAHYKTAVPNWRPGDTIPIKPGRTFRVVDVRPALGDDDDGVLVVELLAEGG